MSTSGSRVGIPAKAYRSGPFLIGGGGWNIITLDAAHFDVGGLLDSGAFNVDPGYYRVDGQVLPLTVGTSQDLNIAIGVNSNFPVLTGSSYFGPVTDQHSVGLSISGIIRVTEQNNQIYLMLFSSVSTSLITSFGSTANYLCIQQIA